MRYSLLPLAFLFFIISTNSFAQIQEPEERTSQEADPAGILSVVFENDLFANRDQYYTNGFRVAYLTSEKQAPQFARTIADYLPFSGDTPYRVSIAVGQNIYTPIDIRLPNPSPDDRPYAGWLYTSVGLVADKGTRLDSAQLTVGMVGPASLAEPTQKIIHEIVNSPEPQGWDNQLKNEPGIMLTLERKWRSLVYKKPFGVGLDLTPHIGASVGNIQTYGAAGATMRLGYNLPQDYGPPRIRPSVPGSDFFIPTEKFGAYTFLGIEGRAVARDIFLDGNTFRDGPSVDKEILTGAVQGGVATTFGPYRLSYTHVLQAKEFKTQKHSSQFGAVTFSVRF